MWVELSTGLGRVSLDGMFGMPYGPCGAPITLIHSHSDFPMRSYRYDLASVARHVLLFFRVNTALECSLTSLRHRLASVMAGRADAPLRASRPHRPSSFEALSTDISRLRWDVRYLSSPRVQMIMWTTCIDCESCVRRAAREQKSGLHRYRKAVSSPQDLSWLVRSA